MGRGITNMDHLKYFVAQTIQENGALDHMATHGDNGCALGIPQYNTCGSQNMRASTFLREYTEWQSRDFQLRWLADRMTANYLAYHGDIRLAIIAHNRPASAAAGQDRCVYFGSRYSCYYKNEVSSKLTLLKREKDQ